MKRFDFWIAVAAMVGVLSLGVLLGVLVCIVMSLLWLIHVATRPAMPILGREPGTPVYRDLDENPARQRKAAIGKVDALEADRRRLGLGLAGERVGLRRHQVADARRRGVAVAPVDRPRLILAGRV